MFFETSHSGPSSPQAKGRGKLTSFQLHVWFPVETSNYLVGRERRGSPSASDSHSRCTLRGNAKRRREDKKTTRGQRYREDKLRVVKRGEERREERGQKWRGEKRGEEKRREEERI